MSVVGRLIGVGIEGAWLFLATAAASFGVMPVPLSWRPAPADVA
jgi:hypothetical protein